MPDLNQRNPHVIVSDSEQRWWMRVLVSTASVWILSLCRPRCDVTLDEGAGRGVSSLQYRRRDLGNRTCLCCSLAEGQQTFSEKRTAIYQPLWISLSSTASTVQKKEETDDWWNGMNRLYNVFCYDYLYPNPKSVMAFIENHDTDRFLGERDTLALKGTVIASYHQPHSSALLWAEVLMNGTKSVTDGNVRKDFPGGWAGDKHKYLYRKVGRTQAENQTFNWLSNLLHWRQGNEVITKEQQTQFCPQKGVYVIARQYKGKNVMTVIKKNRANELECFPLCRDYRFSHKATDVQTVTFLSTARTAKRA